MAGVAQRDVETISNQSGDTFLLSDVDTDFPSVEEPAVLPSALPVSENSNGPASNVSYAAVTAVSTPAAAPRVQESRPYRSEIFLSSFERANFHPDNVTPERPCTAYFQASVFADSTAVFDALKTQGFAASSVRCLQRRPTGEMLITFSSAHMKKAFVEKNSIQISHRRYAINDSDRFLTYLNIYDAPHELSDNAIIKRLEPFCEVVSYRRGRYPRNKLVFNGNRHFRVRINAAIPSYLRFGKFLIRLSHDGQQHTCRRCNQRGHFANDCDNTICFNCDELGHVAESCPNQELCCICKEPSHRARFCPYSWFRQSSPARSPAPHSPSRQEREPQQELPPEIQHEQSLPPRDEPTNPPSTAVTDSEDLILDSQGLLILRQLFGDDDEDFDLSASEDPDPADNSRDDIDNDDDNDNDNDDDDDMSSDDDDDDDDEFEDVDEHSDSVPSPEIDAVESQPLLSSAEPDAANSAVCTPPDTEIKDVEINDAEESQSLFSSAELPSDQPPDQPSDQLSDQPSGQPSDESPPVPPEPKVESGFGPMRTTRRSRRPAPMPEALEAIHRRATNPAPVPSGRAARSDPAVSAEPRSGLPPSSDPGIFDPGPAT